MARIVSGCFRIQVEFAIATEHGSSVGVFFDVIHELPEIDVPGLDVIALQIDAALDEHAAAARNRTADVARAAARPGVNQDAAAFCPLWLGD